MRKVPKFPLLAVGAALFVAACDQAPTTPSDAPGVNAAILVDNPGTADGAADYERLELCKVWVGGAPFTATFTVTATDPNAGILTQDVTIDGTEPTPGCKNVLQFDGTTTNFKPATVISVVEAAPPANWAVTDIDTDLILRDGGTSGEVNAQENVGTRTWTADLLNNHHGVLVTFTNTFTPPGGGEGCTPGYYKNLRQHLFAWTDAGYDPNQLVSSVFSEAGNAPYTALGGATLHEGLSFQGGDSVVEKAEILLRAAIAAVLNADNPNVSYSFTSADIIADVNAALLSQDIDEILDLAKELDDENNAGCPLGNGR